MWIFPTACSQVIDTLCTECASLIEHHEKIQVLSAVHYNLGKTLLDVENIVALPHEAGSAEAMLREDVQLMSVITILAFPAHLCHPLYMS